MTQEKSGLLTHFGVLMGPLGLYQHATRQTPLLAEGYCVDDNARAVQVLLRGLTAKVFQGERELAEGYLARCWQFLQEAEVAPGVLANFRSAEGEWLPQGRDSDDMYARLARALTTILQHDTNAERRAQAHAMLERLQPRLAAITAARGLAECLIAEPAQAPALEGLHNLWQQNATAHWPWFESSLTYANALLPHGVLWGMQKGGLEKYQEMFKASADFLITITIKDDMFFPVGNKGWYPRGGTAARYDQQPIEASTMFDFLVDYARFVPGALAWPVVAAPYRWFCGHNSDAAVVVDKKTRACADGLNADGLNKNCGAESLLAYLWAEVRLAQAPRELQDLIAG
jgi:hypothetical protein